jgi:hypothetical protein
MLIWMKSLRYQEKWGLFELTLEPPVLDVPFLSFAGSRSRALPAVVRFRGVGETKSLVRKGPRRIRFLLRRYYSEADFYRGIIVRQA